MYRFVSIKSASRYLPSSSLSIRYKLIAQHSFLTGSPTSSLSPLFKKNENFFMIYYTMGGISRKASLLQMKHEAKGLDFRSKYLLSAPVFRATRGIKAKQRLRLATSG